MTAATVRGDRTHIVVRPVASRAVGLSVRGHTPGLSRWRFTGGAVTTGAVGCNGFRTVGERHEGVAGPAVRFDGRAERFGSLIFGVRDLRFLFVTGSAPIEFGRPDGLVRQYVALTTRDLLTKHMHLVTFDKPGLLPGAIDVDPMPRAPLACGWRWGGVIAGGLVGGTRDGDCHNEPGKQPGCR